VNALLAGLTPDELFWLATKISRAESYAAGKYVESGDRTQRELFEELLNVRLDAEAAYQEVTRSARASARLARVCTHGRALALAAAPTTRPDNTGGGDTR
jgi:hypothetical protein